MCSEMSTTELSQSFPEEEELASMWLINRIHPSYVNFIPFAYCQRIILKEKKNKGDKIKITFNLVITQRYQIGYYLLAKETGMIKKTEKRYPIDVLESVFKMY